MPRPHPSGPPSVGYVLMGYPRVSETFIASELHRVELAGVAVRLFVLKPVEEKERGLRHPVNDAIAAEPRYLPDTSSLTAPLHRWRPRDLEPFLPGPGAGGAPPAARPGARAAHGGRPGAARPPHSAHGPAQGVRQGAR